jgi:hypothetical protein
MGTCINCGRFNIATETLSFWTARIAGQSTEYVSYKRLRTTTSYADLRHHSYQVCRRCTLLQRWLPIAIAVSMFFIMLVPFALMNRAGLPNTVTTPFLLVVVSAAVVAIILFRRFWKPTQLAMAERKSFNNQGKYAILSEREYANLTHSQLPRV